MGHNFLCAIFFFSFFGLSLGLDDYDDADRKEFYVRPWTNPDNRFQFFYYKKMCDNFVCPSGLVCARLGGGKNNIFRLNSTQGCIELASTCLKGQVIFNKKNFLH